MPCPIGSGPGSSSGSEPMKRILIILAHPSGRGFSRRIAMAYQEAAKEAGHETELLDLYAPENRQDFLSFENIREMPADPSVERMQEKISWADELAFAFPVWWNAEPAILKNFFDRNFAARYAYRYVDGKPVGLLKGKTARIFMTCDSPKYYQWLMLNPLKHIWWLARLRFCGIRLESYSVADRMFRRTDEEKEEFLGTVRRLAKQAAFGQGKK